MKRGKGRGGRRERIRDKQGNRDWKEGHEQGSEQRKGIRIGEKKGIETRTEKELERRKRKRLKRKEEKRIGRELEKYRKTDC